MLISCFAAIDGMNAFVLLMGLLLCLVAFGFALLVSFIIWIISRVRMSNVRRSLENAPSPYDADLFAIQLVHSKRSVKIFNKILIVCSALTAATVAAILWVQHLPKTGNY